MKKTVLDHLDLEKQRKEIEALAAQHWTSDIAFVSEALVYYVNTLFTNPEMCEELNDEKILASAWRDKQKNPDEWCHAVNWVKERTGYADPPAFLAQTGLNLIKNLVIVRIAQERKQSPQELAKDAVIYFTNTMKDEGNRESYFGKQEILA